jgi:hypothetical protein
MALVRPPTRHDTASDQPSNHSYPTQRTERRLHGWEKQRPGARWRRRP